MFKFICGCMSNLELPIPFDPESEKAQGDQQVEYLATFDGVTLDDEGFLICTVHRQRRYGWRVPNHTARYAGMTDLEYESMTVWNSLPDLFDDPLPNLKFNTVPDMRPHIYDSMLDDRARQVIRKAIIEHSLYEIEQAQRAA